MRFKGDIIITDPCYIMREDSKHKDYDSMPERNDYITADFIKDRNTYLEQYRKYEAVMDEWRKENMDDWERCEYGEDMEALGIKTYLCRDTMYGDWSCHTFNTDTKEVLGEFCADAGMVAVFLLEEVLAYNPEFNYHTERTWTTTLIKDFDGEIDIEVVDIKDEPEDEDDELYEGEEVRVIGKGSVNFYTTQTGL